MALTQISTAGVKDDAVTQAKIADGSIVASSIAADAVTTAKIADAQVTDVKLANNSVALSKIPDDTITNAKINASAAIAGTKISPNFGSQNIVTSSNLNVNGGQISISGSTAAINFTDNEDNPDYRLVNSSGIFKIRDNTNGVDRLKVNTDGHIDIDGNLDVGAGIDVTGTVTATSFAGDGSNLSGIAAFPSGTKMLFAQASAPTGWTKQTGFDNRALRLISGGSGGSGGGSNAFSTVFNTNVSTSGGSVSNHTLTESQIPSHSHTMQQRNAGLGCGSNIPQAGIPGTFGCSNNSTSFSTNTTGGGSAHNHGFTNPTFNLNVSYVDVIYASKD